MSDIDAIGFLISAKASPANGIAALFGGNPANAKSAFLGGAGDLGGSADILPDAGNASGGSILLAALNRKSSSAVGSAGNRPLRPHPTLAATHVASVSVETVGDNVQLRSAGTLIVSQTLPDTHPLLDSGSGASGSGAPLIGAPELMQQIAVQMLADPGVTRRAISGASPMNVWALFG